MTVTISIQVMDGVVIGADSTSSLSTGGHDVSNTYDNANKIVNICKGKPIGLYFWGTGSIGNSSLTTLAKDLRRRFAGDDDLNDPWRLDTNNWTVHSVAEQVRQFFYEDAYTRVYEHAPEPDSDTGIAICGYSPGREVSERYEVVFGRNGCDGPGNEEPDGQLEDLVPRGVTDPITRLVLGVSLDLPNILVNDLGLPAENLDAALRILLGKLNNTPVHAAMPIQDAVDLADFLVELTKQWVRFLPGAPTVGGPTEVAAITKHEGFKWVKRKFYYESNLNPE